MRDLKYKIYTLGCKVNQYDSNVVSGMLNSFGFVISKGVADLVLVNTCSVTKIATRKSRQMIKKVKNENPGAKVVMFGCFPKIYPEEARRLPVDFISGVGNFEEITKKIAEMFGVVCDFKGKPLNVLTSKKRYVLKIQEGCEQYCTYCIIPYTRGKLKSRPEEEVLTELEQAIKLGYNEIILTGTHLGLYNYNGIKLLDLLKKAVELEGLGRIRLSSIEINELSDDLMEFIKDNKKICNHLHISLQSGSDKVLKLMNRPYDSAFFKDRLFKIKKMIPDIAITTDIIVGFPGESDKDFLDSYNLAKEIKFSKVHVFSFSAHEKTPAAKMKGVVNSEVIGERSKKLRDLSRQLETSFQNSFKGKILNVAVRKFSNGLYCGTSEHYFDVSFDVDEIVGEKCKHDRILGGIVEVKFS